MRLRLGSWCLLPLVAGLVLALNYAAAQQFRGISADPNPCVSKLNCSECIRTPTCAWCAQPVSFLQVNFIKFPVSFINSVLVTHIFYRISELLREADYQDVISKTNT